MKKIKLYAFLLLLIPLTFSQCSGGGIDDIVFPTPNCTRLSQNAVQTINFFDLQNSSPFFNQVVANFEFSQTSDSYSGGPGCPPMACQNYLVIRNLTDKTISFDYSITFTLNSIKWNYQNAAVIPPGSSVDVGQINSDCGSITLGSILIQSAKITYG